MSNKVTKRDVLRIMREQLHDILFPDVRGTVMKGGNLGGPIQYRDGERPEYRSDRDVDRFF